MVPVLVLLRHAGAVLVGLAAASLLQNASASAVPDLDLILFGATGCVGHLAASHLATVNASKDQPPLTWAIADINQTRLDALAAELKAAGVCALTWCQQHALHRPRSVPCFASLQGFEVCTD